MPDCDTDSDTEVGCLLNAAKSFTIKIKRTKSVSADSWICQTFTATPAEPGNRLRIRAIYSIEMPPLAVMVTLYFRLF
jgi:hypothetical protein